MTTITETTTEEMMTIEIETAKVTANLDTDILTAKLDREAATELYWQLKERLIYN